MCSIKWSNFNLIIPSPTSLSGELYIWFTAAAFVHVQGFGSKNNILYLSGYGHYNKGMLFTVVPVTFVEPSAFTNSSAVMIFMRELRS